MFTYSHLLPHEQTWCSWNHCAHRTEFKSVSCLSAVLKQGICSKDEERKIFCLLLPATSPWHVSGTGTKVSTMTASCCRAHCPVLAVLCCLCTALALVIAQAGYHCAISASSTVLSDLFQSWCVWADCSLGQACAKIFLLLFCDDGRNMMWLSLVLCSSDLRCEWHWTCQSSKSVELTCK